MVNRLIPLLLVLTLVGLAGCDDEERKLRERQQQHFEELQRQSSENAAASRALVEADAESRRQFVGLEQSLQSERQALSERSSTLDADRKDVAAARERVPLLSTALESFGSLALGIAALWVCLRLLKMEPECDGAADLEETLVMSLSGESDLLNPNCEQLPRPDAPPSLPSPAADEPPAAG